MFLLDGSSVVRITVPSFIMSVSDNIISSVFHWQLLVEKICGAHLCSM